MGGGNQGDCRGRPVELPLETLSRGKQCGPSGQVIKRYELAVNAGQLSLKGPTWLSSFSRYLISAFKCMNKIASI